MTLYEEYYVRYRETTNKAIYVDKQPADCVVKDYIWITMSFLTDRNIQPWEQEKMQALFKELQEQKEYKLIDAILKTIKDVQEGI